MQFNPFTLKVSIKRLMVTMLVPASIKSLKLAGCHKLSPPLNNFKIV